MFHGTLNVREAKRFMVALAHEVGLTATVVTRQRHNCVDFSIDLSMNQNRFNSYCHKENGKTVMSPASKLRQMQAENKMVVDFWNGLTPELARARRKMQWWANEPDDSSKTPTIHEIKHGSVSELKLHEVDMFLRTLRVFL